MNTYLLVQFFLWVERCHIDAVAPFVAIILIGCAVTGSSCE